MSFGAAPAVPPALAALLKTQGATDPVIGWCGGELRPGQRDGFAVALASPRDGGRYVVVAPGVTPIELAAFTKSASLDCYSRGEADTLEASIRQSATIHGGVTPRWQTTVVCGFTDDTTSVCWQYAPMERAFVVVGRWIT
jgi:hypothetical protein